MADPVLASDLNGGGRMATVVVVGLGYVGLPLAMRAAEVGHRVAGYDTDEAG